MLIVLERRCLQLSEEQEFLATLMNSKTSLQKDASDNVLQELKELEEQK